MTGVGSAIRSSATWSRSLLPPSRFLRQQPLDFTLRRLSDRHRPERQRATFTSCVVQLLDLPPTLGNHASLSMKFASMVHSTSAQCAATKTFLKLNNLGPVD